MHLKLKNLRRIIGCFGFGCHKSSEKAQLWDPIRATRTAAPSGIGGTRIPAYQQIDIQIADHLDHSTFHGRITPDLFGMLDEALEHI